MALADFSSPPHSLAMYYDNNYKNGPPFPAVHIRISFYHLGKRIQFGPFLAYIDTGADLTCIPDHVLPDESKYYQTVIPVRYADGRSAKKKGILIPNAAVDLLDRSGNWIQGQPHRTLKLVIQDALLGRDILNRHKSVLDGPQMVLSMT